MSVRPSIALVVALVASLGSFACSNGADDEKATSEGSPNGGVVAKDDAQESADSTAVNIPSPTAVRASVSQLPGCDGEGLRSERCFESMREAVLVERSGSGKAIELVEDVDNCVDEVIDYAWPGEVSAPPADGLELKQERMTGLFSKICRWL